MLYMCRVHDTYIRASGRPGIRWYGLWAITDVILHIEWQTRICKARVCAYKMLRSDKKKNKCLWFCKTLNSVGLRWFCEGLLVYRNVRYYLNYLNMKVRVTQQLVNYLTPLLNLKRLVFVSHINIASLWSS